MAIPVGSATVHIRPSFINFTKSISREIRKSLPSIQREAGSLGKVMGDGFASESDGIAAKAQELSTKVAAAKEEVAKASKAHAAAVDKEATLVGNLRVAEQRLAEVQASSTAKQSALIKAQEAVAQSKRKLVVASAETSNAFERMSAATAKLKTSQADLDVTLKKANSGLDTYHRKYGGLRAFSLTAAFQDLRNGIDRTTAVTSRLGHGLASIAPKALSGLGSVSTGLVRVAGAGAMASGAVMGIGSLGTAALGAIGPLASLTASLAPIGGLALALPALGAGMAVGMGVLSVALADAENRLAHLAPQMQALGTSIQDAFWAKATPAVNAVVSALMPMASSLLPQIASGLGGWATALSGVLTSSSGMESVRLILTATRDAVNAAKDGVAGFAGGLLNLAGAGSVYLPQIATSFTNLGNQFKAWTAQIVSDGSFATFVANGMTVLNALVTTITSVVGIFGSIGQAAMSAGHLTIVGLAGALSQVNAALKTPEWQSKLSTFFNVVNTGVGTMSTALGGFFVALGNMNGLFSLLVQSSTTAFASLVNGLTAAIQAVPVQNNITTFLQNLPVLAQSAGALLTPLLTILTSGLSLAGQVATAVAPALGALLTPLAGAVMLAMPQLQRLVTVLGTELTNAARIVAPIFGMFVTNALMPILQNVSNLLPLLSPIATLLMSALAPAFQILGTYMNSASGVVSALVTALSGIIGAITPIVSSIMGMLVPIFQNVASVVFPALISAIQQVGPAFQQILTQMQPVISFLTSVLGPAFNFAFGLIAQLVASFIGHIAGAVTSIIGVFSGLITFVQAVFSGNWSAAWAALGSIVQNALTAIWHIVNVVLIGRVLGLIRSALGLLPGLFSGGFSAIGSIATSGMNFVKSIIQAGMNGVKAFFTAAWNAMKSLTTSVWAGIRTVVSSGINGVRSVIASVMNAVRSIFTSGWNAIRSIVSSVITGIRSVISTGMNAAKSVVTNALNAIKTGFTNGMNAAKSTVRTGISNVVGFFRELPGKITGALSSMAGKLRSIGGDMMRGLVNGIKNGAGAVMDAIGGAAEAAINKAKNILGIHSPSRVFRDEVGKQITAGIGVGVRKNASLAIKPVGALASGLVSAADGASVASINSRVTGSLASYRSTAAMPSSGQWNEIASLGVRTAGGDRYEINVPNLRATGEDVATAIAYQNRINNRR